jgi:hypothetical protein
MADSTPVNTGSYKLWLSRKWYIPVDGEGRVKDGPCAEGALGFVIQLHSVRGEKLHMALKIPRLMGETRRENAYINELSEKELKAVQDVFQKEGQKNGLLLADVADGSIIRGPISTRGGPDEAQDWDGSLVFVCYEKGQNPIFRLVKFDGEKPSCYPPNSTGLAIQNLDFKKIRASSREKQDWENTVFIEETSAGKSEAFRVLSVQQAFKDDSSGKTWYTCLPSIMYNWAPVTLQESISLNNSKRESENSRKGPWEKSKHFELIQRVSQGIVTLHNRNMLHADVRPANIVYQGEPSNPANYSLSDYGSFADPGARGSERNPTGLTVMGPVVSGERVSAFYAPERRHSREREAANTAVIHKAGDALYVILGWRSNLIDDETKKPNDDIKKLVVDINKLKKSDPQNGLVKGDRIQIREYIFDVEAEWNEEDKQILKCSQSHWKVYHGRIVVQSEDVFHEWDSFPIPRTIELKQWQAATDLYSLGALALYSVYCDYVFKQSNVVGGSTGTEDKKEKISEDRSSVEDGFREMLGYLDSKPYFNAVWPELEWMRQKLEENLNLPDLTENAFADLDFKRHPGYKKEDENSHEEKEKKLKGAVVNLVARITQSVPGALNIVKALDYDLGTFIFFIHFVLCCLHRQEDLESVQKNLESDLDWMKPAVNGPFAKDRLETPAPNGAAQKALDRIKVIQDLSKHHLLSGLKVEPKTTEIPPFDPRPTSMIRAELDQTKSQLQRYKDVIDEVLRTEDYKLFQWRVSYKVGDMKKKLQNVKGSSS